MWVILFSIYLLYQSQVTAMQTQSGIAVTWYSDVVVCPWIEIGSVKIYAGGAKPCAKSGNTLVTYIPDDNAVVSLRDENGMLLAQTDVIKGYRVILPIIIANTQ